MDGINDLIDVLKKSGLEEEDLLLALQTLQRIDVLDWQYHIEKEARKQGRCPECFELLEKESYIEWHPFGDTVAGEEFVELSCPEHGMI